MKYEMVDGIPTLDPKSTQNEIGKIELIDVRRPDEFTGELGHIASAQLVTLGSELENFLSDKDHETALIFVCRSGARSAHATQYAMDLGFTRVANMGGGMLLWNQLKLPVEK